MFDAGGETYVNAVFRPQGGAIRVDRVRPHDDKKKIAASEYASKAGLKAGDRLGG